MSALSEKLKKLYDFDKNVAKKLSSHDGVCNKNLGDSVEASIEEDETKHISRDSNTVQETQKDPKTQHNFKEDKYVKKTHEDDEEDGNFLDEEFELMHENSNSKSNESNSFSNNISTNNQLMDPVDNTSEVSTVKKKIKKKVTTFSPKVPISKTLPVKKKIFEWTETYYDMSNADIDEFPIHLIDKMQFIQMLYLANNAIKKLPDELFDSLKFLKYLDVRNNRLKTLPSTVKYHPALESVLLQGNLIESLPLELGLIPQLKVLQTIGNPLVFPPANVLKGGFKSIIHFLRSEWSNNNPEEPIDSFKGKKSTLTVLSSSPPTLESTARILKTTMSKSLVSRKISANEKSRRYKPSNRCRNTLENIVLLEQKQFWLNEVQQELRRQTQILQKLKDSDVLKNWRDRKIAFKCQNSSGKVQTIPFGTDEDLLSKVSYTEENIDKTMSKIISSLRQIQRKSSEEDASVRLEKLQQEINQLKSIKKEIERLQRNNDTSLLYFNENVYDKTPLTIIN